jgi:hypothetical protein
MSDSKIRYHFVGIAFLKGMFFVIPLLLISVGFKLMQPYSCTSVPCVEGLSNEEDRTTFYFVGTSRIQRSISPAALKTELPEYNFVNLGLSSSSFLYACQTASNVMKNNSGKKIIFIELTGLSLVPPDSYYYLLTVQDVAEVFKQHLSAGFTSEDMRRLLFFSFSIHGDIKKTIYPRFNLKAGAPIGFLEEKKREAGTLDAMLTPKSFTIKTEISPEILNMYLEAINSLRKQAEEKGNVIQFILPLTIVEENEFNIDMAVFAELPEEMKWTYSNEFLINMHNRRYLADKLHLNSNGAAVYSHELSDFIRKRLAINSNN